MNPGIAAALILFLSLPPAFAEEGIESSDFPIVLTASRMKQSLAQAPAAVTIIDRDMIEQSGVRQIADLLRLVPGAVVGYNDGNWPVATLRGLSAAYASGLQVLIDGVSVYSPIFGGMFWAELPLSTDDIERIEVVRGPNAASYGANSFQGVVNIITRDPVIESGTQLLLNAGGNGVRDGVLRYAGGQDALHYRFSLGQRRDEGFNTRPDTMRLRYANLRTDYHLNTKDSIELSLRATDNGKETGQYNAIDPTNGIRTQTGNRLEFQTRWSHAESTDDEWWLQYYHQEASNRDRLMVDVRQLFAQLASYPFYLPFEQELDYKSWRDGIEFQNNARWSDRLRTVWGAEARRDAVRSDRLFATNDELAAFLTRFFGNVEWHFADRWLLHSGAMFERNSLASSGWSPRIAVIHEIAPGHSLRASLSDARRTPTLAENQGQFRYIVPLPQPPSPVSSVTIPLVSASGNLDSERIRSEELGYVFKLPHVYLDGDVRWFSDHYRDLIVFSGKTSLTGNDAFNRDWARTRGLEMTVQWHPLKDTHVRLTASRASTTSNDIRNADSVPRSTLSLLLSREFQFGWMASANYQRVGAMFWTDAGQGGRSIPAIEHLNLRLAKRIKFGDHSTEIAGVIQNALGHYRDYYLGGQAGTPDNVAQRVAFLQAKIDY